MSILHEDSNEILYQSAHGNAHQHAHAIGHGSSGLFLPALFLGEAESRIEREIYIYIYIQTKHKE